MADPTTQLAKEFLEFRNYSVRLLTKFYKNKRDKGTPGDIDIIATSPKGTRIGNLHLKPNIVAEVKNYEILRESTLKWIYDEKFAPIDDPQISARQLRNYISGTSFDRILFCLATTEDLARYARENLGIKVITTSLMIKELAQFFRRSKRNWTYYPESYNYNVVKSIMFHLYSSYRFKDPLLLEDLVWINPKSRGDRFYLNRFVEENSSFLEDFIYQNLGGKTLSNLIQRAMRDDPSWTRSELRKNRRFYGSLRFES